MRFDYVTLLECGDCFSLDPIPFCSHTKHIRNASWGNVDYVLVYHDLFTVVYFLFVPAFKFHRPYLEKDTYFSCYCLFLGLKESNHVAGCVFYTFSAILPSYRLVHSSNNWKDSLLSTNILFTPCVDTRQPGTVFKKLDTRQSEILTNFLEIARLIPLRTQDICLVMFSTLRKYSSSHTLSQLPMNIHRNYQRNLTRVFSVCAEMLSDSK